MKHAITFDLFGTLVDTTRLSDPADAVAQELRSRDVSVPTDWNTAYRERHIDAPEGAEVPLPAHVAAALRSRGVAARDNAARRAVVAAFDPDVTLRPGAQAAVTAAHEYGPVGLLSNASVPELARKTLLRSGLSESFTDTVTSVGCGWRKPHPAAFEAIAERLNVDTTALVHVGDDPATDGGVTAVDGRFVNIGTTPLTSIPLWFEQTLTKR
jgi:FMN phosphatase YigB (HAD superfamily)